MTSENQFVNEVYYIFVCSFLDFQFRVFGIPKSNFRFPIRFNSDAAVNKKYAVIGLGNFGSSVAKQLAAKGEEILVIDKDEEVIDNIKDEVSYAIAMDSTNSNALMQQNISEFEAVVVAIGENHIEAMLLTTVLLLEMRANRVIARAVTESQRKLLKRLGVDEVIAPEEHMGKMIAEQLIFPSIHNFIELPDNHIIAEVQAPTNLMHRSMLENDIEQTSDLKLIGIVRVYKTNLQNGETIIEKHLLGNISNDTVVLEEDTLILLGERKNIQKFIELNLYAR